MAPKGRKRKAQLPEVKTETPDDAEVNSVYGRNADAVSEVLRHAFTDLTVEINPEKPRRNSFEVSLLKEDGSKVELWSGIKKGPPRKLKFPEPDRVVEMLKGSLE
uniref:Selenoprotein H n=1 Tax=Sphenodon punctatus TaxID=8508 RepID=A0A8D0HC68_SPHPU